MNECVEQERNLREAKRMSEIETWKDFESSTVNMAKAEVDDKGQIWFVKTTKKGKRNTLTDQQFYIGKETTEKVTPEQCGFYKSLTMEIYLERSALDDSTFQRRQALFKGLLEIIVPNNREFKFAYLTRTRLTQIPQLRDFSNGICSQVNINDVQFCRWAKKPKRVSSSEKIPKNSAIFTENGGLLERRLTTE